MSSGEFGGNVAKVAVIGLILWVKCGPTARNWVSGLGDRTRAAARAFGEDPTPAPAPLVPLGRFPELDGTFPKTDLGTFGRPSPLFPRPFADGEPQIGGSRTQALLDALRPATAEASAHDDARPE